LVELVENQFDEKAILVRHQEMLPHMTLFSAWEPWTSLGLAASGQPHDFLPVKDHHCLSL
jgi:hypothetical protein